MEKCKKGHTRGRNKYNQCLECNLQASLSHRTRNLDSVKEKDKLRKRKARKENNEHINALRRERYKINRKKIIAKAKIQKAWRRAQKLKATPFWVDEKEIAKIYNECPEGMQVDHIIPLKHKLVSGLHVPANLQYLTKEDNVRKHNKFIPLVGRV